MCARVSRPAAAGWLSVAGRLGRGLGPLGPIFLVHEGLLTLPRLPGCVSLDFGFICLCSDLLALWCQQALVSPAAFSSSIYRRDLSIKRQHFVFIQVTGEHLANFFPLPQPNLCK